MNSKMLILGAVLCAAAAGVCLSRSNGIADSEAALAGIVGGQLPRDCVYVRFPEPGDSCGQDMETQPCYAIVIDPNHYYCPGAMRATSCDNEPKYCRERDIYSGDCESTIAECPGMFLWLECVPGGSGLCHWEPIGLLPCVQHPQGGYQSWCSEI